MMAPTHAISGALLFGVAGPLGAAAGIYSLDAPTYVVGTLVCAGAALLPDIDHPKARISNSLPPFTNALAHVVEVVAGGHRHMTHTIWFVLMMFFATVYQNVILSPVGWLFSWLGGVLPGDVGNAVGNFGESFSTGQGGAFLIILYMVTMGILASNIPIVSGLAKSRQAGGFAVLPPIIGVAAAWWAVHQPEVALYGFNSWLPYAVGIGCLAHDLGDMLTTGRVPFFEFPIHGFARKFRLGIPILGDTSSMRESAAAFIMGVAFLIVVVRGVIGFDPTFNLPFLS